MGYAIRVTNRAVEVVTGTDESPSIVSAESSGVRVGLRAKWGGGELRARGKLVPQGSGWTVEGSSNTPSVVAAGAGSSPYASYAGTPLTGSYSPSLGAHSPYLASPLLSAPPYSPRPHSPNLPSGMRSASSLGPPPPPRSAGFVRSVSAGFPPSPLPSASTFGSSPRSALEVDGHGHGQEVQVVVPGLSSPSELIGRGRKED